MTAKRAVGFAPCEFCNEWSASACGVACEIRSFLSSPPAVPVPRVMSLVDTGRFLSSISRFVVQGEEDEEISRRYCGLLISIQDI